MINAQEILQLYKVEESDNIQRKSDAINVILEDKAMTSQIKKFMKKWFLKDDPIGNQWKYDRLTKQLESKLKELLPDYYSDFLELSLLISEIVKRLRSLEWDKLSTAQKQDFAWNATHADYKTSNKANGRLIMFNNSTMNVDDMNDKTLNSKYRLSYLSQ